MELNRINWDHLQHSINDVVQRQPNTYFSKEEWENIPADYQEFLLIANGRELCTNDTRLCTVQEVADPPESTIDVLDGTADIPWDSLGMEGIDLAQHALVIGADLDAFLFVFLIVEEKFGFGRTIRWQMDILEQWSSFTKFFVELLAEQDILPE